MLVREDLDTVGAFIAGITQCMEEGRHVEETVARKYAAMEGVVDECALDVGKRVVQFHRSDRLLGHLPDLVIAHAAADDVPDVDKNATIADAGAVPECQALIDGREIGKWHDLEGEAGAGVGGLTAEDLILADHVIHRPVVLAVIVDVTADLDMPSAETLGGVE